MKKAIHILTVLLFLNSANAQDAIVSIAPFLNGAKGAYTISHDNYCMDHTPGIGKYADSVARAYDIKFTFPIVTIDCDSAEWAKARDMIAYGHEVANESYDNRCGLPVSWCPETSFDSSDYNVEFDLSHKLITDNTGEIPQYFCFPYSLHNQQMIDYLSQMGYLETRSGPQFGANDPLKMDLKRFGFQVFRPDENIHDLNKLADQMVTSGQWGVRVLHGVNDGSWGEVKLHDYIAHMQYLKEKVDSNMLWVSTPTPILNYLRAERDAKLSVIDSSVHSTTYLLSGSSIGTELTIILKNQTSLKNIKINHHKIDFFIHQDQVLFNIPIGSEFSIHYK